MDEKNRRREDHHRQSVMKAELNEAQQDTLRQLEMLGWELKFIRHPLFQPTVPVVFDGDRKQFAVLRDDGTLDDNPGFDIRH
ncbi:hypothetical protein [Pseudomarimonas arenosa]|uniref:Uncharacterized protein n=1 Tax=Pseudomarimonas arenosa TaxID=2774145 RepID=A0AAW3ZGH4_9GAMM|nr:hypothetical protein [Pseudomarimonas arenosa]MBD8524525.1 hypothetical protein [Pseudomarimonas arenosa]